MLFIEKQSVPSSLLWMWPSPTTAVTQLTCSVLPLPCTNHCRDICPIFRKRWKQLRQAENIKKAHNIFAEFPSKGMGEWGGGGGQAVIENLKYAVTWIARECQEELPSLCCLLSTREKKGKMLQQLYVNSVYFSDVYTPAECSYGFTLQLITTYAIR